MAKGTSKKLPKVGPRVDKAAAKRVAAKAAKSPTKAAPRELPMHCAFQFGGSVRSRREADVWYRSSADTILRA